MSADSFPVKSVSIANLVNQRAGVLEKMKRALDLIGEAEASAKAANIGFPCLLIDNTMKNHCGQHRITGGAYFDPKARAEIDENIRHYIDASAWQHLMHESGLRTFMDAETRKKWDDALRGNEVPELTPENIESTFRDMYASRGSMFDQGVIACFKALSWHYKTNLPQMFGKRIVVTNLTGWHSHNKCNQLDDLQRVFHVLDGKPEPDHRAGSYPTLSQAGAFYNKTTGKLETEYLKIKWFKNHNGHIEFTRLDLVERMNAIIAKHFPGALPYDRNLDK